MKKRMTKKEAKRMIKKKVNEQRYVFYLLLKYRKLN